MAFELETLHLDRITKIQIQLPNRKFGASQRRRVERTGIVRKRARLRHLETARALDDSPVENQRSRANSRDLLEPSTGNRRGKDNPSQGAQHKIGGLY